MNWRQWATLESHHSSIQNVYMLQKEAVAPITDDETLLDELTVH